ncbi:MAG: urea amidolyase, partial [bacterium]
NRLVGNADRAPVLEMTLIGGQYAFHGPAQIALTGAPMPLRLAGVPVPMWRMIVVRAGERLAIEGAATGVRAYLAVRGGLDVAPCLGSASTHLVSGVGGLGRALRAGDMLGFGTSGFERRPPGEHAPPGFDRLIEHLSADRPIRITPGLQADWFTDAACASMTLDSWTVDDRSDRMGLRLTGRAIERRRPDELLTEGVTLGAIQVLPDGQPVILFVEHQTTGGYPKIGNLAAVDRHRAGQLRPRARVRFEWIDFEPARRHFRVSHDGDHRSQCRRRRIAGRAGGRLGGSADRLGEFGQCRLRRSCR